jgi:hypothetical protein
MALVISGVSAIYNKFSRFQRLNSLQKRTDGVKIFILATFIKKVINSDIH